MAHSVRDRLLNLARQQAGRVTFNALLRRYMQERLLWRLSVSRHSGRFILKGALRLVAVGFPWARATKDIDLLGFGDPSPENLAAVFRDVCTTEAFGRRHASQDAVLFDADSVRAQPILSHSPGRPPFSSMSATMRPTGRRSKSPANRRRLRRASLLLPGSPACQGTHAGKQHSRAARNC